MVPQYEHATRHVGVVDLIYAKSSAREDRNACVLVCVVLVKQVLDTYSERKLTEEDHALGRESVDAVLDEINERAVEEALQIVEAHGGEVTVVCMGPGRATDAIRKALSMGAHNAAHESRAARGERRSWCPKLWSSLTTSTARPKRSRWSC